MGVEQAKGTRENEEASKQTNKNKSNKTKKSNKQQQQKEKKKNRAKWQITANQEGKCIENEICDYCTAPVHL